MLLKIFVLFLVYLCTIESTQFWPKTQSELIKTQELDTTCQDEVNFCYLFADKCRDPNSLPGLCQECRKSCNLCDALGQSICSQFDPSTTPPSCQDSADNCDSYKSLCSSSIYRSQMCKNCQYTCNLCHDPSCSTNNGSFPLF